MPLDGLGTAAQKRGRANCLRGRLHRILDAPLLFFQPDRWVFTVAYTAFGLAVLAAFILAPPRRRARPGPAADHARRIALMLVTRTRFLAEASDFLSRGERVGMRGRWQANRPSFHHRTHAASI